MIENMLWACAFVLVCILFYRFALPALKRFDDENVQRIKVQATETSDPQAHFRHALDVANEQVEAVQEILTGTVRQYLFETEVYFTREEAEEARATRVGVIARRFYQELPAALAGQDARARRPRASGRRKGETLAWPRWRRRGTVIRTNPTCRVTSKRNDFFAWNSGDSTTIYGIDHLAHVVIHSGFRLAAGCRKSLRRQFHQTPILPRRIL